jgi:MFS family permease
VIVVALFLPRDGDERRLVVFSGLLAAGGAVVAALAFAFLGGLGGAAVAYVALGALFASRIPGNQVVGTRIPDGVRAAAFSVLAGVIAVGQATGPLLAGALTELLGVRPTLVLFAIAAFVVGASMAFLPMREEAVSSPATR